MSAGDRLIFRSMQDCKLSRKASNTPEAVTPEGHPPRLKPGLNHVALSLGPDSPAELHLIVALTKVYQ